MNQPSKSQNVRFRRAFWKNYAEVRPETPKAQQFLQGYGISNPRYWIDEAGLYIKQWLGTGTVGVYVQGKYSDADIVMQQRIAQHWPRFEAAIEKIEYGEGGSRLVTWFVCDGGTRNFWNWDAAANWLEDQRAKYEEILSA